MTTTRWRQNFDDWTTWLGLNGFESEVPFRGLSGTRRWAFDFCNPDAGVAVEYQGSGRGKKRMQERGGHETRSGLTRDREKAAEAQLCGYIIVQCDATTVEDGRCTTWIEQALQMREAT